MEKEKKKKLFDICKKVGITIIVIVGIIILLNNCTKKTKAEEMNMNYRNYNLLVNIEQSTLTSGIYEGTITIIAQVTPTKIENVTINNNYPDFYCNSSELLSGPYETYGASAIETNKTYFVQTEEDYPSASYTIIAATEINTYFQWSNGETYDTGAFSTLNQAQSEAYNRGYNEGVNATIQEANTTIRENNAAYQRQIDSLNRALQQATEDINNNVTGWINFKTLLGLIFMYPIRFFKEGMDVNIYGVNIGGLILGLLMIGVTIGAIGLIMGKRKA